MTPLPFPECYVVFVAEAELRLGVWRRYWWLMCGDEAYDTLAEAAGEVEQYLHRTASDLSEDTLRVLRVFPDGSTELATGEVLKLIRYGDGPMSDKAEAEREARYLHNLKAEWRAEAAE